VTSHTLDTCVPLRLLPLASLGRLSEIKDVARKHDSVTRIETLLRTEYESKWEELRKLRSASQQSLFQTGAESEFDQEVKYRWLPARYESILRSDWS
jgi:hypothetical protein